jgi:hypothetical protein
MKVKILEIRQFKGHNSKEFTNYQVSIDGTKVWISLLGYAKHSDLISIEGDYIILKEPPEDYYEIVKKENVKGKFQTLIPKVKTNFSENVLPNKETETKMTVFKNYIDSPSTKNEKKKVLRKVIYPKRKLVIPPKPRKILSYPELMSEVDGDSFSETPITKTGSKPIGDRIAFINGLLRMSNRKDVSEKTKDRLVELLSKEVGGNDVLLKEIYKDVKEIKERVSLDQPKLNKEEVEGQLKSEEKSKFPKYIDPIKLYSFLFNYNQDPILKYTCHDIDSDGLKDIVRYCNTEQYDLKKHIEKIKEVYAGFEKKHYAPIAVKALIRGYLTGKNFKGNELEQGWSTDRININWSHSDILNWSNENPNFPPNPNEGLIEQNENIGFEIKRFVSVITGKTVQNFRELVLHFKNLFHLRRDNSLKDLIEFKNQNKKWNDVINFIIDNNEFPKNIEFFTDVDKLTQAYTRIVELIIEQHKKSQILEKPKVKLSFLEKGNLLEFSIHHLNSVYGKTIENTIERLGTAHTNLIKNQINGLCNLYVRADFGQGKYAKINIWNGKERESQLIESFKGVEYLLEFPKK